MQSLSARGDCKINSEKNVLVEIAKVSVKGSSPKLVKLKTQPKQILYGKRYT